MPKMKKIVKESLNEARVGGFTREGQRFKRVKANKQVFKLMLSKDEKNLIVENTYGGGHVYIGKDNIDELFEEIKQFLNS